MDSRLDSGPPSSSVLLQQSCMVTGVLTAVLASPCWQAPLHIPEDGWQADPGLWTVSGSRSGPYQTRVKQKQLPAAGCPAVAPRTGLAVLAGRSGCPVVCGPAGLCAVLRGVSGSAQRCNKFKKN